MNQTAIYILSAIDRALKATDPAEAGAEMKRARNLTEILGAQCDAAETSRRYWCNEAAKVMKRMDTLRRTNSEYAARIREVEIRLDSGKDYRGALWPRKRA